MSFVILAPFATVFVFWFYLIWFDSPLVCLVSNSMLNQTLSPENATRFWCANIPRQIIVHYKLTNILHHLTFLCVCDLCVKCIRVQSVWYNMELCRKFGESPQCLCSVIYLSYTRVSLCLLRWMANPFGLSLKSAFHLMICLFLKIHFISTVRGIHDADLIMLDKRFILCT